MTLARLKITFALAAFSAAVAPALRAAPPAAGLLGQRYVEARASRLEPKDVLIFDHRNTGAIAVNLPVANALDLTFTGSIAKAEGTSVPGMLAGSIDYARRERSVGIAATTYWRTEKVAPFARLTGGYTSSTEQRVWGPRGQLPGGRIEVDDDGGWWGVAAGIEMVFGRIAITPAIDYFDDRREDYVELRRGWVYSVGAHLWFTPSAGAFIQAAYTDGTDSVYRARSGDAGIRFRF